MSSNDSPLIPLANFSDISDRGHFDNPCSNSRPVVFILSPTHHRKHDCLTSKLRHIKYVILINTECIYLNTFIIIKQNYKAKFENWKSINNIILILTRSRDSWGTLRTTLSRTTSALRPATTGVTTTSIRQTYLVHRTQEGTVTETGDNVRTDSLQRACFCWWPSCYTSQRTCWTPIFDKTINLLNTVVWHHNEPSSLDNRSFETNFLQRPSSTIRPLSQPAITEDKHQRDVSFLIFIVLWLLKYFMRDNSTELLKTYESHE